MHMHQRMVNVFKSRTKGRTLVLLVPKIFARALSTISLSELRSFSMPLITVSAIQAYATLEMIVLGRMLNSDSRVVRRTSVLNTE